MKKQGYHQCALRRRNIHQVAWIPECFARDGMVLKIRDEKGEWIDGWIVESVGAWAENPPDVNKMIRGHRNNTGDSLPR